MAAKKTKTRIVNVGTYPDNYDLYHGQKYLSELADYYLDDIPVGVTEFYYWYEAPPHEGNGYALYRFERKWHIHCMSHCSCNGPLDDGYADNRIKLSSECFGSLSDIKKEATEELYEEVKHLIEAAKKDKRIR